MLGEMAETERTSLKLFVCFYKFLRDFLDFPKSLFIINSRKLKTFGQFVLDVGPFNQQMKIFSDAAKSIRNTPFSRRN